MRAGPPRRHARATHADSSKERIMHGHRMQTAMALPVLCAALALAGCGGGTGGVASGSQATAATKQATTPSKPPPITPAERRWLKAIRHYDRRLVGTMSWNHDHDERIAGSGARLRRLVQGRPAARRLAGAVPAGAADGAQGLRDAPPGGPAAAARAGHGHDQRIDHRGRRLRRLRPGDEQRPQQRGQRHQRARPGACKGRPDHEAVRLRPPDRRNSRCPARRLPGRGEQS